MSVPTALLLATLAVYCTAAVDVYVSHSGDDGTNCTQIAPCRTLARALGIVQPSLQVHVAASAEPYAPPGSVIVRNVSLLGEEGTQVLPHHAGNGSFTVVWSQGATISGNGTAGCLWFVGVSVHLANLVLRDCVRNATFSPTPSWVNVTYACPGSGAAVLAVDPPAVLLENVC